jgi:glycosyltransferase involved in cell wall biosynthesis
MPNVVLEMSQHAIPLVLAKVGGLPETFDEKAVFFVEPTNEDDAVTAFSRALDQVRDLTADQAIAMVVAARNKVLKRHSPAAFASNVANLFGRP